MTKEQLMQFIEVDSEEDKDDCEFYLDVKGCRFILWTLYQRVI